MTTSVRAPRVLSSENLLNSRYFGSCSDLTAINDADDWQDSGSESSPHLRPAISTIIRNESFQSLATTSKSPIDLFWTEVLAKRGKLVDSSVVRNLSCQSLQSIQSESEKTVSPPVLSVEQPPPRPETPEPLSESEHQSDSQTALSSVPEESEDPVEVPIAPVSRGKKRKTRCFTSPGRESKSSRSVLQCLGMNMKKKIRCRNAALMEYIGPQPQFCAEHISMDPAALYHKCGFPMQGSVQAKNCKEVVFKDFKYCYKHFNEWLTAEFVGVSAIPRTHSILVLTSTLLSQLEQEAAEAKSVDPELYQRKSKLLPKYQSMVATTRQHLERLQAAQPQFPS